MIFAGGMNFSFMHVHIEKTNVRAQQRNESLIFHMPIDINRKCICIQEVHAPFHFEKTCH